MTSEPNVIYTKEYVNIPYVLILLKFALPINKDHSIKIYGHTGINTKYGTDFDGIGIVWQYNWTD